MSSWPVPGPQLASSLSVNASYTANFSTLQGALLHEVQRTRQLGKKKNEQESARILPVCAARGSGSQVSDWLVLVGEPGISHSGSLASAILKLLGYVMLLH